MISQIYKDLNYSNLGNIALFSLYFVFGFSNFFAASITEKLGYKKALFFGNIGYTLFTAAGIIASNCKPGSEDF